MVGRHVCPECGRAEAAAGACADDQTTLVPTGDDALLGESVGKYRIAALIGAGGMGRVYKAVQPDIGARVAVKLLKREYAEDPELVDRFFAEARAVNVIRHENIINVLGLDRLPDGRPYILMEYLAGAPLSALVGRGRRLPIGTTVRLVREVLDALGAAHAKGIVHRDLKPDNVFVTPAGHARVLDFGIAKLVRGQDTGIGPTATGALLGTPAYMSPEQARARACDARADVYAVGVILYEALTGGLPFVAPSLFELLELVVHAAPAPPREKRPDLPEAIEAVILRALAKDPDQRFATAAEMKHALDAALAGLPAAELEPSAERSEAGPERGAERSEASGPPRGEARQVTSLPMPKPGPAAGPVGFDETVESSPPVRAAAPAAAPRAPGPDALAPTVTPAGLERDASTLRVTRKGLVFLGAGAIALAGLGAGIAIVATRTDAPAATTPAPVDAAPLADQTPGLDAAVAAPVPVAPPDGAPAIVRKPRPDAAAARARSVAPVVFGVPTPDRFDLNRNYRFAYDKARWFAANPAGLVIYNANLPADADGVIDLHDTWVRFTFLVDPPFEGHCFVIVHNDGIHDGTMQVSWGRSDETCGSPPAIAGTFRPTPRCTLPRAYAKFAAKYPDEENGPRYLYQGNWRVGGFPMADDCPP